MKKFVAYYRLSTKPQLKGYGLQRQKAKVRDYASCRGEIVKEYTEIRTGSKKPGPELTKAIIDCEQKGHTLIVEDVDRLPRRVDFVAWLISSGVDYLIVEYPNISNIEMQARAMSSEEEVRKIKARSKFALAQAKARGVKLGKTGKELARVNKESAEINARMFYPVFRRIHTEGYRTIMAKVEELNRRGYRTFSDKGRWHIATVHRAIKRMEALGLSL